MTIIADLVSGGIGGIIESVGKVAGDLVTTDKERMAADLAQYEAETKRLDGQTEINKVEAANSNLFVSGWRPAVGWVCGMAFAYASIIEPLLRFAAKVWFDYSGNFPAIDTTISLQALFAILGVGVMRSYDKSKGVDSK